MCRREAAEPAPPLHSPLRGGRSLGWRGPAQGLVADPAIAAHDVLRTATTGDEHEAVDKLREHVVRWHERNADA